MATVKTFTASNFGTTKGGKRNAEFTGTVNGVSMAVRKIELFVVAPEFAPLSDIITIKSDIVPLHAYAAKTGGVAVLNVDDDNAPQNSVADALIKEANTASRDKVKAAAAEYKAHRDAKQAAAIMNNPEALEMVKEMLKEQEAAEKKAAAAAKRAAKKAAAN